jgi:hypothetical protein
MPFISNGTTILDNGAFSVGLGSLVLLSTQTASASASISFTTGIDSTYDIYKFVMINLDSSNSANMEMNFSTDGGSNYNVTKTTTAFVGEHDEADTEVARLIYSSAYDLAQSTSYQYIFTINKGGMDSGSDSSASGSMLLFNPSSTTYVKHFIARSNSYSEYPGSTDNFVAGYCNTTSAVNAVSFRVLNGGGNITGIIKMYGIKGS